MIGKFYTLQEAYDEGFLSIDDLKNIAYHFNEGSDDESFVPTPKTPEVLSEEIQNIIKRDYMEFLDIPMELKKSYPGGDKEAISISKYYGTYGNNIAICIYSKYYAVDLPPPIDFNIGGIIFYNWYAYFSVTIWHFDETVLQK